METLQALNFDLGSVARVPVAPGLNHLHLRSREAVTRLYERMREADDVSILRELKDWGDHFVFRRANPDGITVSVYDETASG